MFVACLLQVDIPTEIPKSEEPGELVIPPETGHTHTHTVVMLHPMYKQARRTTYGRHVYITCIATYDSSNCYY